MSSLPRLSLALLLLAACHHHPAVQPPSNQGGGGGAAAGPPTFDGLFAPGARWTFTVTDEESHWDDQDPAADPNGTVHTTDTSKASCHVADTRHFPGGRAAEIVCDDGTVDGVQGRIAGVWIQTADGLWHGDQLPDEGAAPTLAVADRFLAARPVAGQEKHEEPETEDGPGGGSGESLDIKEQAGGWCVEHGSWGGDESWDGLCLDGEGPASGSVGWAGGSTHELKFERVDPP